MSNNDLKLVKDRLRPLVVDDIVIRRSLALTHNNIEEALKMLRGQGTPEDINIVRKSDRICFVKQHKDKKGAKSRMRENSNQALKKKYKEISELQKVEDRIVNFSKEKICVLVFLRGCPGSGKTTLANKLLSNVNMAKTANYHIFSAKNYFVDPNTGQYNFSTKDLPVAYAWNFWLIKQAVVERRSPLFIDNIHTRLVDMKEVAEFAASNGYVIETLEPCTKWRYDELELSKRNHNNISVVSIKKLLDRYEYNISGADIIRGLTCEKTPPVLAKVYRGLSNSLVKMYNRRIPPFLFEPRVKTNNPNKKTVCKGKGSPEDKRQLMTTYKAINKIEDVQKRILMYAKTGISVMVFMRGLQGSGKTSLAYNLVTQQLNILNPDAYIFSADKYFNHPISGVYMFCAKELPVAHAWCRKLVAQAVLEGRSPIFIDNTNTQVWEMKDLAEIATASGFVLETLEPNTPWKFDLMELSRRNTHGVGIETLEKSYNRYERNLTGQELLRQARVTYKQPLFPPQPTRLEFNTPLSQEIINIYNNRPYFKKLNANLLGSAPTNLPTPLTPIKVNATEKFNNYEREAVDVEKLSVQISDLINLDSSDSETENSDDDDTVSTVDSSFESDNFFIPFTSTVDETDTCHDFGEVMSTALNQSAELLSSKSIQNDDFSIFLKPSTTNFFDELESVSCHVGKKEYSTTESDLGKGYSTTESGLGKGEYSTTGNGLGMEHSTTESGLGKKEYSTTESGLGKEYSTTESGLGKEYSTTESGLGKEYSTTESDLEHLSLMFPRVTTASLKVVYDICQDSDKTIKMLLEAGEDVSPDYIQSMTVPPLDEKIKNIDPPQRKKRHKKKVEPSDNAKELAKIIENNIGCDIPNKYKGVNPPKNNLLDLDPSDDEPIGSPKTVTLKLDKNIVTDLNKTFGSLVNPAMINQKTFVEVPIELAKQLHLYTIEAVYQEMEQEDMLLKLLEDEVVDSTETVNSTTNPVDVGSLREIMDHEIAQRISAMERSDDRETIAKHLSLNILSERFPNLDRNLLTSILNDLNHSLHEATQLLVSAGHEEYIKPMDLPVEEDLFNFSPEQAMIEAEKHKNVVQKLYELRRHVISKAQEQTGRERGGAMQYYLQMAEWYKELMEKSNCKAAMAMLKGNEGATTLDLHSLSVSEASSVLELFLNEHIKLLDKSMARKAILYIVTGRGLHSAGQKPRIKNTVVQYLQSHNINFAEQNPGMLKLVLFKSQILSSGKLKKK